MIRLAIVVLLATGCTVGGSSSVVGRWKAQRMIDSTACVQTQAPGAMPASGRPVGTAGCEKLISIGRDLPARRFQSVAFTFAAPGYMQMRGPNGYVGHGDTLNSYFEYTRGRGRFALGARVGAHAPNGFDDRVFLITPVSVLAHLGGLWGSVYGGVGYSPFALEQQYVGKGGMKTTLPAVYHHNSVHAFVGTRFWLSRTLERGFSFNPEFRVDKFGDATLTSLTGNIGLHF